MYAIRRKVFKDMNTDMEGVMPSSASFTQVLPDQDVIYFRSPIHDPVPDEVWLYAPTDGNWGIDSLF
jgi:hypothetical protein